MPQPKQPVEKPEAQRPRPKAHQYADLLCDAIENEHVSKNALRVLLHLMDGYDIERGYVAATDRTIAGALKLSERTVGTSIQALRKCGGGYIRRTRRGFHFKQKAGGYSHYVPRGFDAGVKQPSIPAINYRQ